MENIKNKDEKLRQSIIRIAKEPMLYLETNFEKGCGKAIQMLLQARNQIKKDASYRIENPDSDFKAFCINANACKEYHIALVSLLKRAGHDRASVSSALMDFLPQAHIGASLSDEIKLYVELTTQAVEEIYGKE